MQKKKSVGITERPMHLKPAFQYECKDRLSRAAPLQSQSLGPVHDPEHTTTLMEAGVVAYSE